MNIGKSLDLAIQYYQSGDLQQAEEICMKILKKTPDDAYVLHCLGVICYQSGQIDRAIIFITRALQIDPKFADAYNNLGNIFQEIKQLDDAAACYHKAIELNPYSAQTNYNLGVCLQDKGQLDDAIYHYQKAMQLNFNTFGLFNNIGLALQDKEELDQAVTFYQHAIRLNPNFAEAHYNLGNVFRDKEQFDEAINCYQKAIQINPEYADSYINLGIVLKDNARLDESETCYKKAIQINSNLAEAHLNLSLVFLLSGNLKEGWENYDWRWKVKENTSRQYNLPNPLWDGSSLTGKTIFVYGEQGIGDEIMFASCLPDVIGQAELCIVACEKRLTPLFSRSFPDCMVIEHFDPSDTYPSNLPTADMKIAIGSLPKLFLTSLDSFLKQKTYLVPDERKFNIWHNRFTSLGDGLKVGISWRGGKTLYEKLKRSTFLNQWKVLFSVRGVHFINLQYGDCGNELKEALEKTGVTIHHWEDSDPLKDLDNFAAQIAALDLVISVDNATVHMAGALGIPVWTLLPSACDWRWMLDYEDTPWYKTVRLFRQRRHGDWEEVFERVASNLRQYISTGVVPETDGRFYYKAQTVNRQVLE